MFMFGMRCVRCDHEIIAPRDTELLDDRVIRHVWHCPSCTARFESFPRFPKGVSEKGPKVLIAKGHHRCVGNAFGRPYRFDCRTSVASLFRTDDDALDAIIMDAVGKLTGGATVSHAWG
jgi:hypothetical protein